MPFTSGVLIGIGETREERIDALFAIRDADRACAADRAEGGAGAGAARGHVHEIIVQNFRAKSDTRMRDHPEPTLDELLWTAAVARIVFGVGLLLMGLELMKGAVGNISEVFDVAILEELGAVEYLLFGLVFTAIVQSSSATMMVTLSALHGGIIDLPAAAAVVIGADLGTTGQLAMPTALGRTHAQTSTNG